MAIWEVQGKTFLITGGASGMGAKYAGRFLDQGAKSIAILDIAEEQGKAMVERHDETHPGKVIFIKCDMSKEDDIAKSFAEVVTKFKQLDVIINNAGLMVDTPAIWRTMCDVNFQGLVSLSMKGLNHMDKSKGGAGGTIVNIASTVALTRFPFLPIYSGSKIAVLHFCQSISMGPFYEYTGVRILCMCFGPTDTPLMENLDKRTYDPKIGKDFLLSIPEQQVVFQNADSAIAAVDHMLKNGSPGSTWISIEDKPAKDITPLLDKAFTILENEVFGIQQ